MSDLEARLAEIRQRRAAATPGPWEAKLAEEETRGISLRWWFISRADDEMGFVGQVPDWQSADAEFIAHAPEDVDWLISQAEKAAEIVPVIKANEQLGSEVTRLRGLLRRLEWRGCVEHFECPACGQRENKGGHDPDCWLAAAIKEQQR